MITLRQIVFFTIASAFSFSVVDAQLEVQRLAKFANPVQRNLSRTGGREVEFSDDGSKLIAAFFGSTVQLFDLKKNVAVGKPIRTAGDGEVGFINDLIAYTSDWDSMRLWDARSGEQIGSAIPHVLREDTIIHPAISLQGKYIATRTTMKSIQLWDASTRKPIGKRRNYSADVNSIRFTDDGKRLMIMAGAMLYAIDSETGNDVAGPIRSGWQFFHFAKQQKLVTTEQQGEGLPQLVIRSTDKQGWPETHRSELPGKLKRIIAFKDNQILLQASKKNYTPAIYIVPLDKPEARVEVESEADRAFQVVVSQDKQYWVCTNIRNISCQEFGQAKPVWSIKIPVSGYNQRILPFSNKYFVIIDKQENLGLYEFSDGSQAWNRAGVNRFSKHKNRIAICAGEDVEIWELK